MANKRIKDLSTTAAVTASDDFIAVDGATNGTRKLDAYSPTFGGNLTVSGSTLSVGNGITAAAINIGGGGNTGTQLNITSADGNNDYAVRVLQNSTTSSNGLYIRTKGTRSGDNALYVASNDGSDAILIAKNDKSVSVGGNLTVSGTGTSDFRGNVRLANTKAIYGYTFAGATGALISSSASDNLNVGQNNANWAALNLYGGTGNVDVYSGATGFVARFNTNGNGLFGTTTDSGNGKLQLATHTTSAGGIGFGTDTSLYRQGAGVLTGVEGYGLGTGSALAQGLSRSGNNTTLAAASTGTVNIGTGADGTIYAIFAQTTTTLKSNGTTALTLDSSQRCILAGALRLNNAYTAGAPTATGYVTIQDSAGNTYKVLVGT